MFPAKSELLSSIPGIVHGFTGRQGGLSQGPFESLNLSNRVGDQREVVETNRRRVLEALGRPDGTLVSLKQVHGSAVVQVSHLAGRSIEADGLWTRDRMAVASVLVADCVPILVTDRQGQIAAAVHAGWRGTRDRIVSVLAKRLEKAGVGPAELVAALGPAIGPCCFQIGDDVASELRSSFPDCGEAVRRGNDGRWNADLWSLNRMALEEAGVPSDGVDTLRQCTSCRGEYFSHRRDQGKTGRQGGILGFAPRQS